jgi:ACS family glucarate transporter-like MFS transporter
MLLTMVQYFASNFTFFICLSWMLPYLKEHYQLSDTEAAGYAMIPLLFGATSQWIAGFVVDALYRSKLREWSRRIPAMIGFLAGVLGLIFITQVGSPVAAVACFALATFGADMTISPSWSYCIDIGGTKSGAVSGSMNMIGNLGSFVSANAFPWLYSWTGSANAYFVLAALLNVVAIACWLLMRPPVDGVGVTAPQTA